MSYVLTAVNQYDNKIHRLIQPGGAPRFSICEDGTTQFLKLHYYHLINFQNFAITFSKISYYSWSLFWFLLITEGAPSRLQRNSSFTLGNHLFGISTIFEKNFSTKSSQPISLYRNMEHNYWKNRLDMFCLPFPVMWFFTDKDFFMLQVLPLSINAKNIWSHTNWLAKVDFFKDSTFVLKFRIK